METTHNDLEKLTSMIKDIKYTMLTTISEDGSLHSRPMVSQDFSKVHFDGTLWFFSRKSSLKNHAIGHEQHVNIAYANPDKQRYISVSGTATISEDKEKMKELWSSEFSTWFPQGLEDPELSLIGVHVDSAEIWDTLPSKMVQLAGFVKAKLTGRPFEHINIQTQH
ncbi:MAG: pyridoxamine 5'-phosphate oxidase family protein [Bacteriovoracaceae bacterium]|nr:pyridoxamine 5'-phosphate oxidase family protein [Bacteriovoracaceae bacterium]